MTNNTLRGSGRSTKIIQALPKNGLLIVDNHAQKDYMRALCRHLGREDVIVEDQSFIVSRKWHGLRFTGVEFDHYINPAPTNEKIYMFRKMMAQVRHHAATLQSMYIPKAPT